MGDSLTFYALAVPEWHVLVPETELIFTDKLLALKAVKQIKGSRLKKFDNYDDAVNYSKIRVAPPIVVVPENDGERSSQGNFPSLTNQDMTPLKNAIMKGDLEAIRSMIWSNPKYLISKGDTAEILMAGTRYNAAHVAAKAGQNEALQLILDTINDHNFIKLMYPKDDDDTTEERRKVLLDSYLNTPEKGIRAAAGMCDTPLHLASKFGHVSCVETLLSFPEIKTDAVNKYEQTPADVICERKPDLVEVKRQIKSLFEKRCYVAIYRSPDGPVIGDVVQSPPQRLGLRPDGQAGPMSPHDAQELRLYLKSPARQRNSPQVVRMTDTDKGVERLSRSKCRDMNVTWIERWPFLGPLVDLATKEGLQALENHFEEMVIEKAAQPDLKDQDSIVAALSNLNISSISEDDEEQFYTPPTSPAKSDLSDQDHELYVQGIEYSKWDIHAYNAMKGFVAKSDLENFPLVSKWFSRVSNLPPSTPIRPKMKATRLNFNSC